MANPVFINRISAYLPFDPVDNEQMEERLGLVGGRPSRARRLVLKRNGIQNRHYVIDPASGEPAMNNAQISAAAIRGLAGPGFELDALDCLVASTSSPDQTMPGHAVMVHGELGSPPGEVVTTAGICLCGMTALKYAWLSVASGESRNAVACGSEVASTLMQARNFDAEYERRAGELENHPEIAFEKDFLRWMLSDGAGAVWLQGQPNPSGLSLRIDWIDILSFADQMPPCMYAGAEMEEGALTGWSRFDADERSRRSVMAIKQDVKLLNDNIVRITVVEALKRILRKRELRAADIDHFLPHYSSEFFRERLAEGLAEADLPIPQERWFTNLTSKGNTGAASIFIILEELFNGGRLRRGERLLCYVPESGRFSSAFMHLTVVGDEA
ncbi:MULTISPECIES: beta-ketoacyl-ACP synthase III [unclassified Pseudomonas]|uniref:beta-ketoacyl-ACP synthase III n=1 Tax=unclassified Pseudomonas TaxID=196821 RepID=UPI002447D038|nr:MULTISPECIES: beta-ketoacyl-ACP synthase III [unclassified Pseudomonas]MDG9926504.1 beta-ketoacyl-ACP synthase III [Pseudomonas sp. GD04042]MDH0481412.1 beta-ketoacyl-ACP synthase III [Pseudomonas sp. GD04015]MDH0603361.1 beta-ketoacyl-ACP synthase III [Pseudomonas sp. GD03869]MDH0896331.1 beta-ketoacyl-ACP synthase III [Pseudomonas sp. GD03875]MDH1066091.1 beta-ketoacyl-ACP synthase III [Pseudomonas sp. GD03985]